jgi:Ca-activated chloride channel family protein
MLRLAHSSAAAAADDKSKPGSIQVLDKKGNPSGEVPLKHTSVKAQISGFISRVTVTQDFENNFPEKIEAVYTFPLPQAAAVDDLTMLIGERTIKGKIMRRGEAQAAYTAAKEQGKVASLLNQERPNVFTQQIANIMPGQQIRIIISYVETLKYEDGSYEWSFPMVVGPRYMPDTSSNDQELHHSPAHARNGMRAGHDISLELDLDAGVPIFEVRSQTHETERTPHRCSSEGSHHYSE